ncbi:ganglioside-induced differentiation-associated protein 1-like [Glandiceps talaboti]
MSSADLRVYYSEKSFYCHRVRIGLREKRLQYKERVVDLARLENLEVWYLRVNPDGRVPALGHDDKIFNETEDILRYLDENFPENTKLFPDPSTEEGRMCKYFIAIANKVDIDSLSLGIPENPDFEKCEQKYSYPSSLYRNIVKVFHDEGPKKCDLLAEENPELKDEYMTIKERLEKVSLEVDERTFGVAVPLCNDVLMKLEVELKRKKEEMEKKEKKDKKQEEMEQIVAATKKMSEENDEKTGPDFWLCGENYTAADVYWSTTLRALYDLGLEEMFWANGKLPLVAEYFERVRSRDSFVQSIPLLDDGGSKMKKSEVMIQFEANEEQGTVCCPLYPCIIV